jgi:hypothetical protein
MSWLSHRTEIAINKPETKTGKRLPTAREFLDRNSSFGYIKFPPGLLQSI